MLRQNSFLKNFKKKAQNKKLIIVLAPMADVTDEVFREMIAKYSRPYGPDIFWTEFVSADGLASPGRKVLQKDLAFNKKSERPIMAQIFGSKKENLLKAIDLIYKLDFDGVDINMGCPDKSIEKQKAGAAMMKDFKSTREILEAVKNHIDKINFKNPKKFFVFSVKTRLGYNKIDYKNWLPNILDFGPDILTIHLRTRKELSLVEAHWEIAKNVVDFIKKYTKENKLKTPFIFLNGDVKNIEEAKEKMKISSCDGIMIGRGVFGTPWLFNEKEYKKRLVQNLNTKKGRENILFRLKVMLEHTKLFEKKLTKIKSFNIMKKHYKAYVNGFDGAKDLRVELMLAKDYKEVKKITDNFIKNKLK